MEESKRHFQHTMPYHSKEDKNTTEMRKKICVVYGEGVVTDRTGQSGLQSFMLEISCWTMLHGCINQLKLIAIKSRQSRTYSKYPNQ